MKNVGNNKKGFTIIEVVLVLAIAGLIFLIVFLAVPALQRSRRDTQRRSDVSRFMAQLENFAANTNGTYPTVTEANGTFKTTYMDTFNDPSSGTAYTVQGTAVTSAAAGTIFYRTGASCTATGLGANAVAATIKLENGEFCQDNR